MPETEDTDQALPDDAFRDVRPDFGPHAASPAFSPQEDGLKLSAPKRARAAAGAIVPLCCSYQMQAETRSRLGGVHWEKVSLVVYREDGLYAIVGAMGVMPAPPPGPPVDFSDMPRDEEDDAIPLVEPDSVGGFRNIDLREQVALPIGPGVFYAFVAWSGLLSNTVRVELTPEGK